MSPAANPALRCGRARQVRSCTRSALLTGLVAVSCALRGTPLTAQSAGALDTLRLRADAAVLADDSMGGRATGTAGARRAANFIAARLLAMGLRPAGSDFLEPVRLDRVRTGAGTTITIQQNARSLRFQHGTGFLLGGGRNGLRSAAGEVVFLGLPAHVIAVASRTDLAGRVVAVGGTLGAEAAHIIPVLRTAGVTAVLQLISDADAYEAVREDRETGLIIGAADVEDPVWQPDLPMLTASPALARALLAMTPVPPLDAQQPFEPLRTGTRLDLRVDITFEPVEAANVVGVLPGSDPAAAGRVVAWAAHYDHLGTGPPDERGDTIWNGFSDNAAGVAMLLAIAEALVRAPPAHTTLFLFFTGEEHGLLGSAEWVTRPSLPLPRIAALINLDGGAPPRPPLSWRIAGGAGTALGETARHVAARHGWTADLTSSSPNSDHWPFQRRGVPAIFIIPGNVWEATSEAERIALRARWDRYHQPGDGYAPEYPFAGIARYATFALEVGLAAMQDR